MANDDDERVEVVRVLLRAGARVNEYDEEGRSPLWHAVVRRTIGEKVTETVRVLLEAGAAAADENGRRLLVWARQYGYDDVADLLAAAGAPP